MKKRSISEKFLETDVIKSKKKCPMCAASFPEVILLDLYIHFWQQPPSYWEQARKARKMRQLRQRLGQSIYSD